MFGLLSAAVLALSTPSQAAAPTTPATLAQADLTCFAVGLRIAEMKELGTEITSAGTLMAFNALGRLEGRTPDVDWITPGIALANTIPEEVFNTETVRCGQAMEAKGEEMLAAVDAYAASQ